jgi:hypothetical protein
VCRQQAQFKVAQMVPPSISGGKRAKRRNWPLEEGKILTHFA